MITTVTIEWPLELWHLMKTDGLVLYSRAAFAASLEDIYSIFFSSPLFFYCFLRLSSPSSLFSEKYDLGL